MNTTYRIVVGIDGTDAASRALHWAIQEAANRGGSVQAVTAWTWDGPDLAAAASPAEQREQAEGIVSRAVASVATPTGVTLATEAVEGRPAEVLSAAAQDADLLVLGSHGHGHLHHAVLGSVGQACVRKATCPVVILPAPHQVAEPAKDTAVVG